MINGTASEEEAFGSGMGGRTFVVFAGEAERCAMRLDYPMQNVVQFVETYGHRHYRFAPLPTVDGGSPANRVRGYVYAINSQVTDPAKRAAALAYIKFMCSAQARRILVEHFVSEDWGQLLPPHWLKELGYDDVYQSIPPAWRDACRSMREHMRLAPLVPKYPQIEADRLKQPLQRVLLSGGQRTDLGAVLRESAKEVNTSILGQRAPSEMAHKRLIALAILLVVASLIAWVVFRTIRTLSAAVALPATAGSGPCGGRRWRHHLGAWVFLLPAVAATLVFRYYPLVRGSVMAFFDWKLLGGHHFIGLDNFIEIFSQPGFYDIIRNTAYYVTLTMSIGFMAPIILALLLSEVPRGKVLFRVIFYLPSVTTMLVIMFLWKMLYDPAPEGVLNNMLAWFGLAPQQWLADPSMAMICVVIPFVWAGAGAGCIIYLAALHGVPADMYEAADIDGAGVWKKLWCVTLPYLKPLLIINFIGAFIGSFHATANILMMTGGGPLEATRVIGIEIFTKSFLYLKFGYATALAWIMGAFLIGFTMQQLKFLGKVEFSTTEK